MPALLPVGARGILKPGGPQPINPAHFAVPNGLVGYWGFDPDCVLSSTLTADLSGGGKHGTLSGTTKPAAALGQIGSALSFDGSTGYVSLGANAVGPLVAGAPAVSLSAWLKYGTLSGAEFGNVVFDAWTSGGGAWLWMNVRNDAGNVGKVEFGGRSASADAFQSKSTAAALAAGSWSHGVGINNYVMGTIQVYVNGALSVTGAATFGSTTFSNSTAALADTIGSNAGASNFFNGSIDEVRIYNRALSPGEVIELYQAGLAGRRGFGSLDSELPMLGRNRGLPPFQRMVA